MSGQLYGLEHIGQSKVSAISNVMMKYSGYYAIYCNNNRYTRNSPANKIMICGFDNMDARRLFFSKWKTFIRTLSEEERKDCLFIDGRLAAEEFQVFCIKGDDTYHMHYTHMPMPTKLEV